MSPRTVLSRRPQAEARKGKSAPPVRVLRDAGIAPKLLVAAQGDSAEREADRVADAVTRAREARAAWSSAPPPRPAVGAPAPANVDRVLSSGRGRPLDTTVRREMESAFQTDFGGVRVFTHPEAARSASDVGARAYSHGSNVVFGSAEYAPRSSQGRRLLAHELTHVARSGTNARDSVQRSPARADQSPPTLVEALADPPASTIRVSVSGLTIAATGTLLAPGDTESQLMAIVLRTLIGGQYYQKLVPQFLNILTRAQARKTGYWLSGAQQTAATSTGGQQNAPKSRAPEVPTIFLDAEIAVTLLHALRNVLGFTLATTREQEDVLITGLFATKAWAEIRDLNMGPGKELPQWYTRYMFDRQVAKRVTQIETYARGLNVLEGTQRGKDVQADELRLFVLQDLVDILIEETYVLDDIRRDTSLLVPEKGLEGMALDRAQRAANAYRALWEVKEGEVPSEPPIAAKDEWTIVAFLGWSHSQRTLGERAETDRDARVELLARFGRYLFGANVTTTGDELLRTEPGVANAPPFDATLLAYPQLQAPLYQAALESEHRFEMRLHFRDVYEAFSYYHFRWQLVPVKYTEQLDPSDATYPTPKLLEPAHEPAVEANTPTSSTAPTATPTDTLQKPISEFDDTAVALQLQRTMENLEALSQAKGAEPSDLDRLQLRFANAVKYHREDLQTIHRKLGPVGTGASDLAHANAILRYIGAVGGVLWDKIFERDTGNWSDKKIAFPKPGLYVVRAIGVPFDVDEEQEIIRAPSVAYQPVFVRPAAEIAAASVYAARQRADDERALSNELVEVLDDKGLAPQDRLVLQTLQQDIAASQKGVFATIKLKLDRLNDTIAEREKEPEKNSYLLAGDYEEKEKLEELLRMRKKRKISETAVTLNATFISDGGQSMPLDLEADVTEVRKNKWTAKISDLTSIRSGAASGFGATRKDAIIDGVKNVLQSIHGYGRGMLALELDNKIEPIRIAADVSSIVMEGIENVTTILSIAAIAAAPFTGGATLTLLIPIGAVGAIPSIYRLVARHEVGTLRWDFETAMELVNIVGAIAGAGHFGAATRAASAAARGIRPGVWAIRAGRGLLIVNRGADVSGTVLLGAGVLLELDANESDPTLTESERADRRRKIIGRALLQAGIAVGGSLASERVNAQMKRKVAAREIMDRAPDAPTPKRLPATTASDPNAPASKPDTQSTLEPDAKPKVTAEAEAKSHQTGSDPRLSDAVEVTDKPGETAVTPRKEKLPEIEEAAAGRSTPEPTKADVDKSAATAEATTGRRRADPLESALANGEPVPAIKLDSLHPGRTSAQIPAHFTWDKDIADWPHAIARYDEARRAAPERHVAVWRNSKSRTFAVTVGTGADVQPPGTDFVGVLRFRPHPDSPTRFQLPAAGDLAELHARFKAGGSSEPVRAFIDTGTPEGKQARVEVGVTADKDYPYYVTREVAGEKITARFREDGKHVEEWNGAPVNVDPVSAKQMARELQIWLDDFRRIRTEMDAALVPAAETPAEAPAPKFTTRREGKKIYVSPVVKPPAPPAPAVKRGPFTDRHGLTNDGRAWVRDNIPAYADKPDIAIDSAYSQHGTIHEAVNRAEAIAAREGIALDNPNAYLITKGYRGRKQEPTLAGILREIRNVAKKAGRAFSGGDESVTKKNIDQFVGLLPNNATKGTNPDLMPDLQALAQKLATDPDPRIRAEFEHFYYGEVLPDKRGRQTAIDELYKAGRDVPRWLKESNKGWAHTKAGNTRPDMTELDVSQGSVAYTDLTHRYTDPVHNFKMKVYEALTKKALGNVTVTGNEYRGPLQQNPID